MSAVQSAMSLVPGQHQLAGHILRTPTPIRLPPVANEMLRLTFTIRTLWRFYRRTEVYQEKGFRAGFLTDAAAAISVRVLGEGFIMRAAQGILITTCVLDAIDQGLEVEKKYKNLKNAIWSSEVAPASENPRLYTSCAGRLLSDACEFLKVVAQKIGKITWAFFSMLISAGALSMYLADIIDAFYLTDDTKHRAMQVIGNITSNLETGVKTLEKLISRLEENPEKNNELLAKIGTKENTTTLIEVLKSALGCLETAHKAAKSIPNPTGGIEIVAGSFGLEKQVKQLTS